MLSNGSFVSLDKNKSPEFIHMQKRFYLKNRLVINQLK